ncbi:Phage integrase SAM-like domain-containing protein [Flavobacterium micromati]|uniref:Phage integrase SAM-like domain-containing protein n=1 Tax=Flavobacterium micromati TaxID=229205 RepID=A0A1M5M7X8_9FLAO|nr:phage integrase SAM-like domain-containing protein [Flavobacterium micromati]SHG73370.1 Phage integrase SAM-like domain-containing protein [Flavobacterium micromati]
MATIKFILQSKTENSNIYVRYSIDRKTNLKRKTGFVIDFKDWSEPKAQPIQKNDELKALKSKLDKLAVSLETAYNNSVSKGGDFTGEWLQLHIDFFNNKTPVIELDILTTYIQKYIDDAPYKQNQKKETGLSSGRVQNIKLFKNTILRYEDENLKGKSIIIKDINLQFVEKFKLWLFDQKYSVNYVGKNINNLKTICFDASKNDIETSTQLKNIKSISEKKAAEQIITLSEQEQDKIKDAILLRKALVNARKWLLLGCLIGQRGGDLLNITANNIKDINGIKIIELKQQKTGKLVAIPLLPDALEIVESGLPYKISLVKFNEYLKDICKIAELNEPTTAKVKVTSRNPLQMETKAKYNFISSHVCRRSFATNFYGRIPTPVLMNITAHGTEKVFLAYIGKTTYDNAYQMLEYFSKLAPRPKTAQLEVIHNTGTK